MLARPHTRRTYPGARARARAHSRRTGAGTTDPPATRGGTTTSRGGTITYPVWARPAAHVEPSGSLSPSLASNPTAYALPACLPRWPPVAARPPFLVSLVLLPYRTYVEKTAQLDARHPATLAMDKSQKNRSLVSVRISCANSLQTPVHTHRLRATRRTRDSAGTDYRERDCLTPREPRSSQMAVSQGGKTGSRLSARSAMRSGTPVGTRGSKNTKHHPRSHCAHEMRARLLRACCASMLCAWCVNA